MSSNFKKTLNNNIIAPYNKYSTTNEKIADVINTSKKKRVCDIAYINIDGIYTIAKGISIKKQGAISWFPKTGDKVEITISGNTVRIIGEYVSPKKQTEEITLDSDFFSNNINGTNGGYIY